MAGPWEQYQSAPAEAGPWEKYAGKAQPAEESFWHIGRVSPERAAAIRAEQERKNAEANKRGAESAMGLASGFADLGDTLLNVGINGAEYLKNQITSPTLSDLVTGSRAPSAIKQWNDDRNSTLEQLSKDNTSLPYKVGRVGGNIAATAPIGGVLGATAKFLGFSPAVVSSLTTGGFRAGGTTGAANVATRTFGGAATGGASTSLVDPDNAAAGAFLGGVLPSGLQLAGKAGNYAGSVANYVANATKSFVQPFTQNGQREIAGNIVRRFAEGGPTTINAAPLVPGSIPTLAEATGNAGIARLQNTARDLNPNRFAEREVGNAAARAAAFDEIAGDSAKLDFFRGERSEVGKKLYGEAMAKGVDPEAMTPAVRAQIAELSKRPSIKRATMSAKGLAAEDGLKLTNATSLEGLHYTKLSLDQQINEAVRAGDSTLARSLMNTKDMLDDTITALSPAYAEARATFAEMSKPVNQMEVLQGLKLTDTRGNITLPKIQATLDILERKIRRPGTDAAKSLTSEQLTTLKAIRDDLVRQSNLNAGKAAGANTFQNFATDNMIDTMLPGPVRSAVKGKAGTLAGQFGQLLYSKPNEAIKTGLLDMMLDPTLAAGALAPKPPRVPGLLGTGFSSLTEEVAPHLYRAVPLLSSYR